VAAPILPPCPDEHERQTGNQPPWHNHVGQYAHVGVGETPQDVYGEKAQDHDEAADGQDEPHLAKPVAHEGRRLVRPGDFPIVIHGAFTDEH